MNSTSRNLTFVRRAFVAALFLAALLPVHAFNPTPAEDPSTLSVVVRTKVDKPFGFKPADAPKHGKVYYIISLKEIKLDDKLVRPVDESGMLDATKKELTARGFRQIRKGETPEIVITVDYGRGYLANPYMAGTSTDLGDPPTVTITGAMPTQLLKQKEVGFETKMRRAQLEKLYIIMTAYKFPSPKGKRPELAWKTTMLVDNPEKLDLNKVYQEMIVAGGNFFDQEMKDEEADLVRPMPEGRVEIGTPEVVKENRSK